VYLALGAAMPRVFNQGPQGRPASREPATMSTSVLNFEVRIAHDGHTLREACAVRAQAYGHHVPGMAALLADPDATDRDPGTVVLVCRDKASGGIVGTARIQRNHPRPLPIEASVMLPAALAGQTLAEITRLAVRPGADALVRPMLMKACWLYAVSAQIHTLVIGARSAALIRIYRKLGFADLLGEGRQVPLAHAGGLPHSVLSFDVMAAERVWHAARHALYDFMVETWHPDLQLQTAPTPAVHRKAVATALRPRPWVRPCRAPAAPPPRLAWPARVPPQ
jgi:hypothetical protein